MTRLAMIFSALSLFLCPARADEPAFRVQPEPDFESVVIQAVKAVQAQDAFAGLQDCLIVDSKSLRPFPLAEAEAALKSCAKALSSRYSTPVDIRSGVIAAGREGPQVVGLALLVPPTSALTGALMRDLNYGLALRGSKLLGHPALVRRQDEFPVGGRSAVQQAVDACILPAVIREIDSAADFLRHYGRCIQRAPALKVKELRASPAHRLGVILMTSAEAAEAWELNGAVIVDSAKGPVQIMILAYSNSFHLP